MQGGIRNINSLKQWFTDVGLPFFTLSYYGGSSNQVIMRNVAIEDMGEAWELLKRQVLAQSEGDRATMQLIVYKKGAANNYEAKTNIDIFRAGAESLPAMEGIGSLSAGYVDEAKIAGMIAEAREKWDMERRVEDLETQLNSPSDDWMDKGMAFIERIGATPFGQAFAAKFLGGNLPPYIPAAQVAGHPSANEPQDTFEEDIDKTAELLGVDDTVLARKLRQLVETNPELAKSLLQ